MPHRRAGAAVCDRRRGGFVGAQCEGHGGSAGLAPACYCPAQPAPCHLCAFSAGTGIVTGRVDGGVVSVLVLPAPPIFSVTACAWVPLSATVIAPIVTTTPAAIAAATTLARAQMPRTVDPFVFILDLVPYVIQANGGEPWSLLPAASAIDLIPRSCGSCPGAVQRNAYRLADDDGHEVPGVAPRGAGPGCAGERLRITDTGHCALGERPAGDPGDIHCVPLALQLRDGVLYRPSARRWGG